MKNDGSCQKKEKSGFEGGRFDQKDDLILFGERSEVDDSFFFSLEKNERRHSCSIFRSITVLLEFRHFLFVQRDHFGS